ncbi:MAG: elongation factor 4 [Candidatus Atribacteria bacterium]|jgi:GTP-binding protein LepA|nr:elongation factor 4 [Candidatus Atribacteria bacterium]
MTEITKAANIRNFSIIAHIDHGKSTIADRILELTETISQREIREQVLDDMDLEREKGITIKSKPVRLLYKALNGKQYIFNLIDTPGHVDFSYEVSRSLAACEGALMVVDAAQGVQAQTISNVQMALEHKLSIIPVINKIDLSTADPEKVSKEIKKINGLSESPILMASARDGTGIREVLEAIVKYIPPPDGKLEKPLQALIFDSVYNPYQGSVVYIRIVNGVVKPGSKIQTMSNKNNYEVNEVGIFMPKRKKVEQLSVGEVGYLTAGFKDITLTKVGDTITNSEQPADRQLPGYKKVIPMVFCSFYPVENDDYPDLKYALEKLSLNDSAISYIPENSPALGFGFRCGFLGLLHMEIIQERLEREYQIQLIATTPSVLYRVYLKNKQIIEIDNPSSLPEAALIDYIEEPFIELTLITPSQFLGGIMELLQDRRGVFKNMEYLDKDIARLLYHLPLNEIMLDFYDRIKSISKGYASIDYHIMGYQESALIKVDVLVNQEVVDNLSFITHKDKAYERARKIVDNLKTAIPRQLFEVPIQASVNRKIIARSTVRALKKNVIAKCYGGDISRKRKLLEKQKAGKKRMKRIGKVEIPQEAFMSILKID